MSGIDLAKQYWDNKAKIEQISKERDSFCDAKDAENRELHRAYLDKVWALEKEERALAAEIDKARDERSDKAKEEIAELRRVMDDVERIVYFLKLKPDATWKAELEAYGGKELVALGPLYKDGLLDLRLFAIENGRPKNRWTLVGVGRCAFDRAVLDLPRGFLHANDWAAGLNVIGILAHLPSVEDVEQYHAKHKGELMRPFIQSYRIVEQEYLDAVKTYKLEDFAGIEPATQD